MLVCCCCLPLLLFDFLDCELEVDEEMRCGGAKGGLGFGAPVIGLLAKNCLELESGCAREFAEAFICVEAPPLVPRFIVGGGAGGVAAFDA